MFWGNFFLFIMNMLLFSAGIVEIAISSVVIHRGNEYKELLLDGVLTLPILILILGIILTILGFLGSVGILKESKCMLYTYTVLVFVVFLAGIVLTIYVLIYPGATKNALENFMNKQFQKYNRSYEALTMSIDKMQKNVQCCGVNGTEYWTQFGKDIPDSCLCNKEDSETDENCQKYSRGKYSYQQSCIKALIEDLMSIGVNETEFWTQLEKDIPDSCLCNKVDSETDETCQKYSEGKYSYHQGCIEAYLEDLMSIGVNRTQYWTQLGKDIPDSCLCKKKDSELEEYCQKYSRGKYSYQQSCIEAVIEDLMSIGVNETEFWNQLEKDIPNSCFCSKVDSETDENCQKYSRGKYSYQEDCIDAYIEDLMSIGVNRTQYWTQLGKDIPYYCLCKKEDSETEENCQKYLKSNYSYQQGCIEALIGDLKSIVVALGVAALVLGFLMFFSMTRACRLTRMRNNNQTNKNKQ